MFSFDERHRRATGGWIANDARRRIDFAGGTAVHINAGAAGLALAIVLGKRRGWPREPMRPHNLHAGHARRRPAVVRLVRLQRRFGGRRRAASPARVHQHAWSPPAAAMLAWLLVERIRDGKPTSLGAASGIVAGLVAITPACSSVSPLGAHRVGVIAGVLCALAVGLKFRFGYDDSLDVVGVHLVGGLVGTLLIGFFATAGSPAGDRRPVLRRRRRPAVAPGRRRVRGAGLLRSSLTLILAYIVKVDHRPAGDRRGRGRRYRRDRARGDRLRLLQPPWRRRRSPPRPPRRRATPQHPLSPRPQARRAEP